MDKKYQRYIGLVILGILLVAGLFVLHPFGQKYGIGDVVSPHALNEDYGTGFLITGYNSNDDTYQGNFLMRVHGSWYWMKDQDTKLQRWGTDENFKKISDIPNTNIIKPALQT